MLSHKIPHDSTLTDKRICVFRCSCCRKSPLPSSARLLPCLHGILGGPRLVAAQARTCWATPPRWLSPRGTLLHLARLAPNSLAMRILIKSVDGLSGGGWGGGGWVAPKLYPCLFHARPVLFHIIPRNRTWNCFLIPRFHEFIPRFYST